MAGTLGEDIIRGLLDNSLTTLALEYKFSVELIKRIATALQNNSSVTTITIGSWYSAGLKKKMPEGFAAIVTAVEDNYNITSCTAVGLPPHGRYKEPAVKRQVDEFVKQTSTIVKRNLERCYLITVTLWERQSDGLRVSCSSLGGDEVAVLTVGYRDVASVLYSALRETLVELLRERRLVLLLTDGTILQTSDTRPLTEVFTRKEYVLDVFRNFDSNGDGIISVVELREVMKRVCKETVDEAQLQQLFGAMDIDQDGSVSTSDFLDFVFSSGDAMDVKALMNMAHPCEME